MAMKIEHGIKESEVWGIVWVSILLTLTIIAVLILAFWDKICAKIVIDALESGIKQLPAVR